MAVRAIDGDDLVEQMERILSSYTAKGEYPNGFTIESAIDMVVDMPTITPPNEWVSVEERLPESQADVLVVAFWHERWQTMIGWYSDMEKKWRVITPHREREPGGVKGNEFVSLPRRTSGFLLEALSRAEVGK